MIYSQLGVALSKPHLLFDILLGKPRDGTKIWPVSVFVVPSKRRFTFYVIIFILHHVHCALKPLTTLKFRVFNIKLTPASQK